MRGKTMFLRLFLTLLLMAGLTVDFHTMSLSFGTSVYAFDNDDDWEDWDEDGDDDDGYFDGWDLNDFVNYIESGEAEDDGIEGYVWTDPDDFMTNADPEVVEDAFDAQEYLGITDAEVTRSTWDEIRSEEENNDECEGEQCDICGGYKSAGTAFRSSGENAPNCPACTCVKTPMPDCDSITTYTGLLINTTEYKAALESMRTLSNSGTSACRLLFDNGIDEQNGLSRNLSVGDTYSDLGSAMSAKKSSEDVVGVVYSVGEGQHMLTDRQMLDLVKYSNEGFSTAYIVDGSHVYAVRFENFNMSQTYLSKYERYIMDDGEFDPWSDQGQIYEIAKGKTNGVLEAKSVMYNYMDISLSLLQSNTSDNGDLLFSKINSCYSQETKEVNTETCGEGGGK